MGRDYVADVDFVLTTRELAELFRIAGVNPAVLEPEAADTPFGERSSAGKLFGASGGVMEAAVRSAYFLLTGGELKDYKIQELRGMKGCKELRVQIGDLEVGAAVVSSLGQARKLMEEIKAGRRDIHFIEVMTCPGGCINGGGQPIGADLDAIKARMQALYQIDRDDRLRVSHKNEWVQRLYAEFLGEPLGHKSHELLHTHYEQARRADVGTDEATRAGSRVRKRYDHDEDEEVLVVDDDIDQLDYVAMILEAEGYDVIKAQGQKEGEEAILTAIPDLAILDLMMENMDSGFVLCHQIKRMYPDTPVILLTAVESATGVDFSPTVRRRGQLDQGRCAARQARAARTAPERESGASWRDRGLGDVTHRPCPSPPSRPSPSTPLAG